MLGFVYLLHIQSSKLPKDLLTALDRPLTILGVAILLPPQLLIRLIFSAFGFAFGRAEAGVLIFGFALGVWLFGGEIGVWIRVEWPNF